MSKNKVRTLNSKKGISKLGKIWIAVFVVVFVAVGAFVIYRSFAATMGASVYNVPSTLYQGNRNNSVYALKTYLKKITQCQAPWNNEYDATTVECVKNFQRFFKLNVDGIVGPATWSSLFKVSAQIDDQSPEASYNGSAPTIISTQKAYGGALIRVKCTSSDGVKHQLFRIYELAFQSYNNYGKCGTDGTAYVGVPYSTPTTGQHIYEIISDDSANSIGGSTISWPTFVTVTF